MKIMGKCKYTSSDDEYVGILNYYVLPQTFELLEEDASKPLWVKMILENKSGFKTKEGQINNSYLKKQYPLSKSGAILLNNKDYFANVSLEEFNKRCKIINSYKEGLRQNIENNFINDSRKVLIDFSEKQAYFAIMEIERCLEANVENCSYTIKIDEIYAKDNDWINKNFTEVFNMTFKIVYDYFKLHDIKLNTNFPLITDSARFFVINPFYKEIVAN